MKTIYLMSGLMAAAVMVMGCSAPERQARMQPACDCAEHVWGMVDINSDELELYTEVRAYLTQCLTRPMSVREAMTIHDLDVVVGLGEVYMHTFSVWSAPIPLGHMFLENMSRSEGKDLWAWDDELKYRVVTVVMKPSDEFSPSHISFELLLDRPAPALLAGGLIKQALLAGALWDYRIVGWAVNYSIDDNSVVVMYEGKTYTWREAYLLNPDNSADRSIFGNAATQPGSAPEK